MSSLSLNPDHVAEEWVQRISQRLLDLGVPTQEVEENAFIIGQFTRTAVDLLQKDPTLTFPEKTFGVQVDPIPFQEGDVHQIIDLFIRSVNQMVKELRHKGVDETQRNQILEQAAWETFHFAKLLVGITHMPNPEKFFKKVIEQKQDPKMTMVFSVVSQCLKFKDFLANDRSLQRIVKTTTGLVLNKHMKTVDTNSPPS